MRKFILSMALAIVSVGAYAQAPVDNCTPAPNKPEIGTKYTYQVAISGGTTPNNYDGNGVYQWYVTQNGADLLKDDTANALDVNNDFFAYKGGSPYNSTANTGTTNSIDLEWKPNALMETRPFYLVLKYSEDNTVCLGKNVKVMKINPLNNFKLTITPVKNSDGDPFANPDDAKVCSSEVTSASIVGDKVKYVYGETKLYYKVKMTGFTGSWKPTIYLPELKGTTSIASPADGNYVPRKYTSVKWNVGTTGAFETFANVANNGTAQDIISENATNKQEFILEVTIDNGTYEGLTDEAIAVATKGQMVLANNSLGKRDVDDNCNEIADDNNKKANQKILARPTVTATSGNFIIQIQ
ncbi:conserved exported hypothetical protein [Capnocytophaga canimorsus]|uniref:Uncharacterized protein n=2 Tax=Capnocytophaga canimorsus TaxID=28188 RepID=A0A0B7HFW7_9FLAO|nr:hypothetical protein [Capnocytophaga canimorsus]ATA77760.1 hypothetical protein CGC47_09305 [Capnocytophaga canimorsus]PJI76588.1 hypothetical protein CLV61_1993 [Capnocytophaga canimorsus]CEN36752.1 conserved exported hypothetical protein [Capnocytophaga canimorsus]STA73047.1 Uncharacterised protein [Capnocytophaga canimorsus]